jgi:hypothetical protein
LLPNFLVIGAPRCGTTSLYEYLNGHPDVYMSPVKEPDFFSRRALDNYYFPGPEAPPGEEEKRKAALDAEMAKYAALFEGAGSQKRRGEASAIYLAHPTSAAHIRRYIPDARLVAILRDPADRAHSHFVHATRVRTEYEGAPDAAKELSREFEEAVDRALESGCPERTTNEPEIWVRAGFYHKHLCRFRSIFPENQVKVFLFKELANDPQNLIAEVLRFLEIDDSYRLPTTTAFNASVVPKNRGVFRFFTTRNPLMRAARSLAPPKLRGAAMRARNRVLAGTKPAMDPGLRRRLVEIYREDIEQLEGLLGRDLSGWKRTEVVTQR